MTSRTTELLLEDIVLSADKILTYTRGMNYYDFTSDDKTVDAVVRNIEIIEDAAAKIPDNYENILRLIGKIFPISGTARFSIPQ
jgi:uncharacterized protein with HEPN domain